MAISHDVMRASPEFADWLTVGLNSPDQDACDAALTAMLDLHDTEDCVDMWRLGGDVGEVLNRRLEGSDDWTISYLEPELVAEFARHLGGDCAPGAWYDEAVAAGVRFDHPQHRDETEQKVAALVVLITRAAQVGAGLAVWHSV